MRFFVSYFILLCTSTALLGQTAQCSRSLADAETAFDQGRLQDVIDALNKENGSSRDCYDAFTIDEEIRAEKLLTKAYLFTDNPGQAEQYLVDLLNSDKEHQLAKNDPAELHHLYSQYRTEPIFRVGFRAGANKSLVTVLQDFSNTQGSKSYNGAGVNGQGIGIGFFLEALVERHLKKGIEVGLGAQYRIASYDFDAHFVNGNSLESSLFLKGKNQSTMLRIPVLVRYNFNYDKKTADGIRLNKMWYVFAGGSFDYVLNAQYVDTDRTGGTAFTLNTNASLTDFNQVSKTNGSIFGGAGLKLRMGRALVDFLTFEVRYDNSLFNYIDPANRYANKDLNIDIGFVEDDLTINTVSVSVGYTRSFYRPKKRKQYR